MMKNTPLLILTGLLFMISACNKDEPKFVDKPSDELVKYVINLSGSKITDYSKYINDELVEVTTFIIDDTVIERISKNANDKIIGKAVYQIGPEDVAVSSVDSSFTEQGIDIYKAEYEYTDGFLVEINANWTIAGNPYEIHVLNTIEDENVVSSYFEEPLGYTNRYRYNDKINKIDLNFSNGKKDLDFSNGITGKWSKNLVEHVLWQYGLPCGSSSSIPVSDYIYEQDSGGYVTKRIETYTPCYHTIDPGTVTRTISTTIYEYHKN